MTTVAGGKDHARGVHQSWEIDFGGNVKALWVIPDIPPSLNKWERMHWSRRSNIKNSWEQFVWLFQRTKPIPTDCEWVYASAEILFRRNAHRDLSNYDSTFWKIFPDVLQRAGILADDTEEYMRRGAVTARVDSGLGGHLRDQMQVGCTRVAIIAHPR